MAAEAAEAGSLMERGLVTSALDDLKRMYAGDLNDSRYTLSDIPAFIARLDTEGGVWPAGLFRELSEKTEYDFRYLFMSRFVRSALFGELLVREYALARYGSCSEDMLYCGRLLNMFVTAFDSVCDEIDEELPQTLGGLAPLFKAFPQQAERPFFERTLSGFTLSIAYSLAESLGTAIQQLGTEEQQLFTKYVRGAFESQVRELSLGAAEDAAEAERILDAKSTGPFAVALLIPHAFYGNTEGTDCIGPVSASMGRLFGWVDDLADWDQDDIAGKTSSLNILLGVKELSQELLAASSEPICQETEQRYHALSALLQQYGLSDMDAPLRQAMNRWLFA